MNQNNTVDYLSIIKLIRDNSIKDEIHSFMYLYYSNNYILTTKLEKIPYEYFRIFINSNIYGYPWKNRFLRQIDKKYIKNKVVHIKYITIDQYESINLFREKLLNEIITYKR